MINKNTDDIPTLNAGEMVEIISKAAQGIEWRSSAGRIWYMRTPTLRILVADWDTASDVEWHWNATLPDGTKAKVYAIVPAEKMAEIRAHLLNPSL